MGNLFLKLCNNPKEKGDSILIQGESLDGMTRDIIEEDGERIIGEYYVTNPNGHYQEIEINEWSWGSSGITNTASYKQGKDHPDTAARLTSLDDIVITKNTDRASAYLASYCAYGTPIPFAVITCRKNRGDDDPLEYLIVELENVMVSKFLMAGSKGEHGSHDIIETVHLRYEKVRFNYQLQDRTGQRQGTFPFEFEFSENKSSGASGGAPGRSSR
jgi:type VI protein secretion system component Hcp